MPTPVRRPVPGCGARRCRRGRAGPSYVRVTRTATPTGPLPR